MTDRTTTLLIATTCALSIAVSSQDAHAQSTSPTVRAPQKPQSAMQLQWLAGCWQRKLGSATIEEHWMSPAGGVLLGTSRTTVVGLNRGYEFLRIFSSGDTIVYVASPSGQKTTEFRSTKVSEGEVLFENPTHDFPQKIGYRAVGPDSLHAFIEGPRNGETRRIDYPYARAVCPGK
jgi:hypothetical protein